jgi:esterase/lipase superfamily enzyme
VLGKRNNIIGTLAALVLITGMTIIFVGCGQSDEKMASGMAGSRLPQKTAPVITIKPAEPTPENTGNNTESTPLRDVAEGYNIVRVHFATDRNLTGEEEPGEMFGAERSDLIYGFTDVSIPENHVTGELESPSYWRLEFSEDPTQHVMMLGAEVTSGDQFFVDVSERVRASSDEGAFLFVHGFNVSFEDAARRTAQMSNDLQFDGAPVFYSWPSQGSVDDYNIDENNIIWTQVHLRGFLEEFFDESGAANIYIIAHSMGNRALTRTVADLLEDRPDLRPRLQELILAAPDIDADIFREQIAPALTASGRPVTLYASSEDVALQVSRRFNGHARAGDSGDGLIIFPGIETIDATGMDTGFLKHSYFAESRPVIADIFALIRDKSRADNRFGLTAVDAQGGRYWKLK